MSSPDNTGESITLGVVDFFLRGMPEESQIVAKLKKPHRVISSEAFKDDWGVFFGARVYVAINCTT